MSDQDFPVQDLDYRVSKIEKKDEKKSESILGNGINIEKGLTNKTINFLEFSLGNTPNIFYYLFDIAILFFLGIVIYYNAISLDNIKKSKKIVLIDSTTCKIEGVPEKELKGTAENDERLYPNNPFNQENLVVSRFDNKSFNQVCLELFCSEGQTITGDCNLPIQNNYQLCLNLTRPDKGCTNNSKPIVSDDNINYYLDKIDESNPF